MFNYAQEGRIILSEKFSQISSRLQKTVASGLFKLKNIVQKAWFACKDWSLHLGQRIKYSFINLRSKWPGWKHLLKKYRHRLNPVRPDLPAVKGETQMARPRVKQPRKKPIRRTGRQRVYRLKGYTTVAKVNRKYKSEMQQSLLRKALIFIAVLLLIILLYNLYNPFNGTDITEWYRIIGISDWSDLFKDNPLLPELTPTPQAP